MPESNHIIRIINYRFQFSLLSQNCITFDDITLQTSNCGDRTAKWKWDLSPLKKAGLFLNFRRWLNAAIRPALTARDAESSQQQTDMDPCAVEVVFGILLQPTTCSFVNLPGNSWMESSLWRTGLTLLQTSVDNACWNQFAARLLQWRIRENKQILISIINQGLHLFLIDKDELGCCCRITILASILVGWKQQIWFNWNVI